MVNTLTSTSSDPATNLWGRTPRDFDEVKQRVDQLTVKHSDDRTDRERIKAILEGGVNGLRTLLGEQLQINARDVPAVNLMDSSLTIFASKLGRYPTPKADPPYAKDTDRARNKADKIRQIVAGWDEQSLLPLALQKAARRVGAYSYAPFIIGDRQGPDGRRYPVASPRDPHDCYLGQWSELDQQPVDLAVIRKISIQTLERHWPQHAQKARRHRHNVLGTNHRAVVLNTSSEYDPDTIDLVEYHNIEGSYLYVEGSDGYLEFTPNPLESGPRFVVFHTPFTDDRPRPSMVHVLGLMAAQAKLNTLQIVAARDAVFRETNIIGQLLTEDYEFGRRAVNVFAPGTQIDRPSQHVDPTLFTSIDRVERQIRVQLGYPVTEDGISPMSYTTGAGVRELGGGPNLRVNDTQKIFKACLELVDQKRLEWDDRVHRNETGIVQVNIRGKAHSTRYTPARDIDGYYRTRRPYGAMALTFDDPTTIVTGLQLLQAGVIDLHTFREQIDGLEGLIEIDHRVNRQRGIETLYAALGQLVAQGDPAAGAVLARVINNPDQLEEELARFFTPDEPQMTPQEEALLAAGNGQSGGPPPPITTILSRLEMQGGAEGGVQTVGTA